MKVKKKREMDPNIVRPNLFSHDKEIRGIKTTHELAMQQIVQLQNQVRSLERKLRRQTDYLSMLAAQRRR